jgi:hypothetical protein
MRCWLLRCFELTLCCAVLRCGVQVTSTHLISSRSGEGVAAVASKIARERKGRDVFVVGAANVGKSAFVRALLKEMSRCVCVCRGGGVAGGVHVWAQSGCACGDGCVDAHLCVHYSRNPAGMWVCVCTADSSSNTVCCDFKSGGPPLGPRGVSCRLSQHGCLVHQTILFPVSLSLSRSVSVCVPVHPC